MVAMVALAAGKEAFSDYSHVYSPHKFTQPQLFACLVLKEFERKDYRGIHQLLLDWTELREMIGLKSVPHYTTLQKASRRLLAQRRVRRLVDRTVRRIRRRKRNVRYAAIDSTGFDAHHISRYFIWRRDNQKNKGKRAKKRHSYRRYGKLMIIVDCATHAILSAVASTGPSPDVAELEGALEQLPSSQTLLHMIGDAGFDSARNHRLLREQRGIRSTIPAELGRPTDQPPTDKYRRLMRQRFNTKAYRHRSQIETVNSMLKRNLGSALRARTHWGRCRDLYLRVLTHNIALALLWVFYRAGQVRFSFPPR
jgi:DDE family transposase